MHIPGLMLNGEVCWVTLAAGAAGVGLAGYVAAQASFKPAPARFAAVTALIFALQMLNYPVLSGTSGHLVGGALGVALLGAPFAVLAVTVVLVVQAVLFGDGGVMTLGANVLTMALIGPVLAGVIWRRTGQRPLSLALTAWLTVVTGAAVVAGLVALSGGANFSRALPAMVRVHALIGIGEALLTVGVVYAVKFSERWTGRTNIAPTVSFCGLAGVAALVSPLASGHPDGLQRVAAVLAFRPFNGQEWPGLFPGYQAFFTGAPAPATIVAALIGIAAVSTVTWALGKAFRDLPV